MQQSEEEPDHQLVLLFGLPAAACVSSTCLWLALSSPGLCNIFLPTVPRFSWDFVCSDCEPSFWGGTGERRNATAENASLSLTSLSSVLAEDRQFSPHPAVGPLDPWLVVDSAQCFLS